MGAPKLCCICVGEGAAQGGGGGGGKGGGKGVSALNPRTIACVGCPRVLCLSCVSRNVSKSRQPPSPAKGGGGVTVAGWLCPVCDPKSMASAEELQVCSKRRAAFTKAAEAGV